MDWTIQDYGALGEVIGSIGVIATLVYVAIQIRQNGKLVDNALGATRAQNLSTITSRYNAISFTEEAASGFVVECAPGRWRPDHAREARDRGASGFVEFPLGHVADGTGRLALSSAGRPSRRSRRRIFEFVNNAFLALPVVQAWYETQRDLGAFSPGFRAAVDRAIAEHRDAAR